METNLTRAPLLAILAATIATAPAWADGRCDLNDVVGYQLLFGKPIEAYIQDGTRKSGYVGCEPDRVLVFADNTGVKCKSVVRQTVSGLVMGYLFIRAAGDLKLCVDGELLDVSQTN